MPELRDTLVIDRLDAGYGTLHIVRDVSFTVAPGEIVALLGPNGAGKTTTLRGISGVAHRLGGSVCFAGQPLDANPYEVARRGVAHVPQGRRVFGDLSVTENLITATLRVSRVEAAERMQLVMGMLPALQRLASRRAGALSGGEQQMLAVGRALAAAPRIVMIDELSLGLAPKVVAEFGEVIRRVAAAGVGVLLVEQFATFARRLSDRVLLMSGGSLVFNGSAEDDSIDRLLHTSYLGSGAAPPETAARTRSAAAQ